MILPTAVWKQGTSRPLAAIYVASQHAGPDVNGPVYWRMKLGKGKHNPQSTPQLFAHQCAPFSQLELRACRCSRSAYIQADGAWWWITLVYNIYVFQVCCGVQMFHACWFGIFSLLFYKRIWSPSILQWKTLRVDTFSYNVHTLRFHGSTIIHDGTWDTLRTQNFFEYVRCQFWTVVIESLLE